MSGAVGTGALVTGAGRGLGAEIARRLARRGHLVHVTDVDGDAAARVASEVGGFSSVLDVRDQDACRAAAQDTVARAGSLAVWVNNAGVLFPGPSWEATDAQRALTMEVNALGTMHGTFAALDVMRPAARGHVVNVASLAALTPVPGEAVYAGSKWAALGLGLSVLTDLRVAGFRDIHVSAVCPDGMWTPMLHDKLDDPGAAMSFSGKLLQPEEVADLVEKVLDRPRPVVAAPRWRGAQARLFAAAPRLAVRAAPLVVRVAKLQQKAARRRLS